MKSARASAASASFWYFATMDDLGMPKQRMLSSSWRLHEAAKYTAYARAVGARCPGS